MRAEDPDDHIEAEVQSMLTIKGVSSFYFQVLYHLSTFSNYKLARIFGGGAIDDPALTILTPLSNRVYALNVIGVLPDVLWNMTFLYNLDLGKNYLTGPLSASVRDMIHMQYLNLGINALSGPLPRELEIFLNY